MNIKEVEIENFKCIDHMKFKPKKINLIVGKNNTGKTSLLEALCISRNPEHINNIRHKRYLIGTNEETSKIKCQVNGSKTITELKKPNTKDILIGLRDVIINSLKSLHKSVKIDFTDSKEGKTNSILEEKLDGELISSLEDGSISISIPINNKRHTFLTFEPGNKSVRKTINLVEKIFQEINTKKELSSLGKEFISLFYYYIESPLIRFSTLYSLKEQTKKSQKQEIILIDEFGVPPRDVVSEKEAVKIKEIEDFIKSENLLDNLDRFDLDYIIFKKNKKKNTIPFRFMGGGFKTLIGILWRISGEEIENKILLMEEPGRGMHPGYIKELIEIIVKFSKEKNVQFFITTHNTDFIDLFLDEDRNEKHKQFLKDNFSILRMGRAKDDFVIPDYMDYKEAKESKDELQLDLRGI